MIRAPLKLKMPTSVLQDDVAAAMGDDGGDVGGHPSSPTAGTLRGFHSLRLAPSVLTSWNHPGGIQTRVPAL